MLNPGIKGSASVAVTAANTAAAMGSGELNVIATPALAALVEKACWQSVAPELDPGCGTVGTKLELAHRRGLYGVSYWNLMRPFPQNWVLLTTLYEIED